jgi:hypothetical protein
MTVIHILRFRIFSPVELYAKIAAKYRKETLELLKPTSTDNGKLTAMKTTKVKKKKKKKLGKSVGCLIYIDLRFRYRIYRR